MSWSPDARAGRDRGVWAVIAAAILAFQGVAMVVYAGLLPRIGDVVVELPVLGRAQVVYLAAGALAIVAAIGVARRRPWGRALGVASAIVTFVLQWVAASSPAFLLMAALLPTIVLFGLMRHWPGVDAAGTFAPDASSADSDD